MYKMAYEKQEPKPADIKRVKIGTCEKCGSDLVRMEMKLFNKTHIVKPICKCEAERNRKIRELEQQREENNKLRRLFDQSRLGERFKTSNFDNIVITEHNSVVLNIIREYAENFNGKDSLLLTSHPGTGKTMMASAVANYLLARNKSVIFTTAPDLVSKLSQSMHYDSGIKEWEILNGLDTCQLLILDDLGAEEGNRAAISKLFQIINRRYDNMKAVIFTTNLSSSQIKHKYGERTFSRIVEMCQRKILNLEKEKDWRMII